MHIHTQTKDWEILIVVFTISQQIKLGMCVFFCHNFGTWDLHVSFKNLYLYILVILVLINLCMNVPVVRRVILTIIYWTGKLYSCRTLQHFFEYLSESQQDKFVPLWIFISKLLPTNRCCSGKGGLWAHLPSALMLSKQLRLWHLFHRKFVQS